MGGLALTMEFRDHARWGKHAARQQVYRANSLQSPGRLGSMGRGRDGDPRVSTFVTEKTWEEWLERLYSLRRDKRGWVEAHALRRRRASLGRSLRISLRTRRAMATARRASARVMGSR